MSLGTIILVDDRTLVLTPEKVVVSYQLAGFGPRIMAHLVDLFVVFCIYMVLAFAGSLVLFPLGTLGQLILNLAISFGIFVYFVVCEGNFQGRTLGKRAFGLRVIMADGTPVTWGAAFMRNMLRPADMMPPMTYLVGLATMFSNNLSQRVGDMVAGTVVVRVQTYNQGFAPAPHRAGVHPLEHTVGDLGDMSLEEYVAIKRLCDRFPYLPREEQDRTIREIWNPFAQRLGIGSMANVHPIYQMEAAVMKFGRQHKLV